MAHTDKDRPYWVRIRESGIIDHNHERGVCIIDDDRRNRWGRRPQHDCPQRIVREWTCTKAEPNVVPRYGWYSRRVRTDFYGRTCWTWVRDCDCQSYREHSWLCPRVRVQCIGHSETIYDRSIPCEICDEPRPTCFPTESAEERYSMFGGGGVPHWFVAETYHRPERRRARDELRDMVKEWNSNYYLEDGDYFSPQGRNSARWYYW